MPTTRGYIGMQIVYNDSIFLGEMVQLEQKIAVDFAFR
jgi:hypothetical protein